MAAPVTTAGSLTCSHGGNRLLSSSAKLTVGGQPVLLFAAVATPATYVGCIFTVGGSSKPCATTTAASPNPGSATVLTVGGAPVLLDALQATTENPPSDPTKPFVTVAAGQIKLTAS